ncbi:unnamed protein product [Clavelina lepadiformis]|uniref:Carbohydrate kinase PfkB domain-containing protein n=1 Tax=Clavelina lepadiformis TaxID=159417 RepID=A0ABP0FUN7_CLALP
MTAYVICAWGEAGAASGVAGVFDDVILTPANSPEDVVDTVCAGDTFLAGIRHSLIHGKCLNSAVKFACRIASEKVGSYGYDCLQSFHYEVEVE